jgi:dCMP deaminase
VRPVRDEWGLELALVTARRATCYRRSVGCVLVNARGHVLATGYNGVAAGLPHCNEFVEEKGDYREFSIHEAYPHACSGARSPSGANLDACQAIHAEQNALLQCRDVYDIHTCYVTTSPCVTCVKLLLNSSCERVVFAEPYAHDQTARDLWDRGRRGLGTWLHLPSEASPG